MDNKISFKFGDYALIEQKRHGVPNEMFVHKVIDHLRSNTWVDVPVQSPATETIHGEMEDVCLCICCGVSETEVRKYRVKDMHHRSPVSMAADGKRGATITLQAVNELIASLESVGELSLKEEKYLALAKAFKQLAAENVALKSKGRELLGEACAVYSKLNKLIDPSIGDFVDGQTLHEFQFVLDAETPATDRIIAGLRLMLQIRYRVEYCQKEGLPYQKALHDSMMLALEELQERRKAEMDNEPYGFTDGDRRGMIYKPEHADRLNEPVPVYRHAQPAPEYPETLPCPVLLESGLRFGKGVKTRLVLEAIQRRAEHYAELEAMPPEERAEYDAGIEAFKAMLQQPAPAVPDGYVLVPKEMTDEIGEAISMRARCCGGIALDIYDGMLAAAMLEAGTLTNEGTKLTGNSPINAVTAGKPFIILLPDISSKVFWSGAGKNETFHPETYRRWVKEAIERYCAIARIDVEVK
ncbi:hypothetical protein ACXDS0_003796 [Klebsiella variicola]